MAGLDPEFEILDEGLAGRLRERALTAALREFLEGERGDAVDLLAAYGADRVRAMVEGVYAELRSRGRALAEAARIGLSPTCPPGHVPSRASEAPETPLRAGTVACSWDEADAVARLASCWGLLEPTSSSSAGAARSTSTTWSCARASCWRSRRACARPGRSGSS